MPSSSVGSGNLNSGLTQPQQKFWVIVSLSDVGALVLGFLCQLCVTGLFVFKEILLFEYTRLSASIAKAANDSYWSGKSYLVL